MVGDEEVEVEKAAEAKNIRKLCGNSLSFPVGEGGG